MAGLPLGLLPMAVLWTLVCLGLGAWTMNAVRRLRPVRRAAQGIQPGSTPRSASVAHVGDYDAAVGQVLDDGVITHEEQTRLHALRHQWGLSPADHARAVARVQEKAPPQPREPDGS